MKRVIIIMAKVPRAGNVKTRLRSVLAPAERETLAEAFLADAIEKTRNLCDRLIIAFAPADEKGYFARFDCENLTLARQTGADLGEKMYNAFEFAFRADAEASVVMIGTDSPTFPAEFINRAFENLESNAGAVLGASEDGGFYLVGLRQSDKRIFENVEWSSPRACSQTARNIERLNINLKTIPAWYDVDARADLRRLRDEILSDETAQKRAPQTFEWLLEHSNVFDSNSNFRVLNSENKS